MVDDAAAAVLPDADLIQRIVAGDREAFAAIYARHHAKIFRFARLMSGSSGLAEDIVQDVFLTLMREASHYRPDRAALSTYLYGIARRQTRRRLLRQRRFLPFAQVSPAREPITTTDVSAELERSEELRRLRVTIVGLPSRYREVLVLCDLQEVPYAVAAQVAGCAVGTVRSRLHRARQLLAEKMRRAGGAPTHPFPIRHAV